MTSPSEPTSVFFSPWDLEDPFRVQDVQLPLESVKDQLNQFNVTSGFGYIVLDGLQLKVTLNPAFYLLTLVSGDFTTSQGQICWL